MYRVNKNKSPSRKILGLSARLYNIEKLQRLLQHFEVTYTKNDLKADLFDKLEDYLEQHPKVTAREREEVLNLEVDEQHIRWQVKNNDGSFHRQSYPKDLEKVILNVTRETLQRLDGHHRDTEPKGCQTCYRLLPGDKFPSTPTTCCEEILEHCTECIDKSVSFMAQTSSLKGGEREVKCLNCEEAMEDEDIEAFVSNETYEAYTSFKDSHCPTQHSSRWGKHN